jgi:15-cis-phytoene synthase
MSAAAAAVALPGNRYELAIAHAADGVRAAADRLERSGAARLEVRGQLIRPVVALAGVRAGTDPTEAFWWAALAIQLAHEASLVHDDIVDGAAVRRGEPTRVASLGVGPALVLGDHLLTSAYLAAARTGSAAFARYFAQAVERTVAGEIAQGRGRHAPLGWERYAEIARGKAGELLACALAIDAILEDRPEVPDVLEAGRRLGLVYQMLDDLLDYLPAADTGKPPFADYRQEQWTWVLAEAEGLPFGLPEDVVRVRLHGPDAQGSSPVRRALERLLRESADALGALPPGLRGGGIVEGLLADWGARALTAVTTAERAITAASVGSSRLRFRVPMAVDWPGVFARNGRTFRFAARLFPPRHAERIERVYAFCRVTDDLVDRADGRSSAEIHDDLDGWIRAAGWAYRGTPTGVELVDRTMADMAKAGVPFHYVEELVEGMRMDLRPELYRTMGDLRRYTHRVASVVGLWMTELFGVRDAWTLERAGRLGHAMQLTNILRDVGEDWRQGRLYLPTEALDAYGLREEDLASFLGGAPIDARYRGLVEALLREAEAEYAAAFAAIPRLPREIQPAIAVAAYAYRGIHAGIRRNGYDNLHRRARTTGLQKVALAGEALLAIRSARAGWTTTAVPA